MKLCIYYSFINKSFPICWNMWLFQVILLCNFETVLIDLLIWKQNWTYFIFIYWKFDFRIWLPLKLKTASLYWFRLLWVTTKNYSIHFRRILALAYWNAKTFDDSYITVRPKFNLEFIYITSLQFYRNIYTNNAKKFQDDFLY